MRCPGHTTMLAVLIPLTLAAACPSVLAQAESKSFMAQPGDTLVVQNDYGKILVNAWESSLLEVQIRKNPADKAGIRVATQKSGSRVFIYAFFSGSGEESVDLEIKAPSFMNAVISGANPEIEIHGLQGFVRTQTFTGSISTEDLAGSVSLVSDSGDIVFRSIVQPRGDARLESNSGTVRCDLAEKLNLRCWLRAGGAILWEKEPGIQGATLEKQLGTFGPLFYAASLKGSVVVSLKDAVVLQAPPPADLPRPAQPQSKSPAVDNRSASAPSANRDTQPPGEPSDQRPTLSRTPASPRTPPACPRSRPFRIRHRKNLQLKIPSRQDPRSQRAPIR